MEYTVKTFRDAGLEARWTKTRKGAPIISVRNPASRAQHQREQWWLVDNSMWKRMAAVGIVQGFDEATLLGNWFSLPA